MSNTLQEFEFLVSDTLEHITSAYTKGQSLLISEESHAFFSSLKKTPVLPTPQPAPITAPRPPVIIEKHAEPAPILKPKPSSPPKIEVVASPIKPKEGPSTDFSEEIKKQLQKLLPHVTVVRDVPSDDEATLISESWKQPTKYASVLIFSFSESPETEKFLFNVKKAIEAHFCSCAIIDTKTWEDKKEWDAFFTIHNPKLIISSPEVFKTKQLLTYYKENVSSKERFLHSHPFMLLLSLSTYIKQPEQKKVLWNSLCNLLKKNP